MCQWLKLVRKSWKTHQNIFPKFLENSSKNVSEISVFRVMTHEADGFLENSSRHGNTICVMPRNSFNIIFRLNALFWMSFPEIGKLTLIGKSWKTHPQFYPKFQFSGAGQTDFWKTHPVFCRCKLGLKSITNSHQSDIFNILLFLAIMVQLPLCMDGNFVWRTCIGMYLPKKFEKNFEKIQILWKIRNFVRKFKEMY